MAAALKAGKTTALFYAGGGEQNGPHTAFGKHNVVARHVVERIAKDHGIPASQSCGSTPASGT